MAFYQYPPVSPTYSELSEMTTKQLEELNSNPEKLDEFLENLPQYQQVQNTIDSLLQKNVRAAASNLEKRPEIEGCKQRIVSSLEHLSDLRGRYEELAQRYQHLSDRYAPSNIQEALKIAAQQEEEACEDVADKFLTGEIDVEAFLQLYIKRRSLSHCRKVKEEKLHNQLMELQRSVHF